MTKLDTRLAKMVTGAKRFHKPEWSSDLHYIPSGKPWRTHSIDAIPVPQFSIDIAACFGELVPWLAAKGWRMDGLTEVSLSLDKWQCLFRREMYLFFGRSDTPEMAIALAAEAVGKAEGWITDGS